MNRLLFLSAFFFYVVNCAPAVMAGDSGELVVAAFHLGIPHPSGYPLYTLFAKIFTFVPLGNVAFRVNVMSSAAGALAVMFSLMLVTEILKANQSAPVKTSWELDRQEDESTGIMPFDFGKMFSSVTAAVFLAASGSFWFHSVVSEVYTLNAVFAAMIFLTVLRAARQENSTGLPTRPLCLAAFLAGLGLGNHHTLVLLLPALIVMIYPLIIKHTFYDNIRRLFLALSFFTLGFSVYMYLPLRAQVEPLINWGNPSNFGNFISVLRRKGYGVGEFARPLEIFIAELKSFDVLHEIGIFFVLAGIAGAYCIRKREPRLMWSIITAILCFSLFIILAAGNYEGYTAVFKPFYIPAYLFYSLFGGAGLYFLLEMAKTHKRRMIIVPLFLGIVAFALLFQLLKHYPQNGKAGDFLSHDHGLNQMNSFDENALYLSKLGNDTFVLWYLQAVERYREDVEILPVNFLTQRWHMDETMRYTGGSLHLSKYALSDQKLAMIEAIFMENSPKRHVYSGFLDDKYLPVGLYKIINGVSFRLSLQKERPDTSLWEYYRLRSIRHIDSKLEGYQIGILESYASAYYNHALELDGEGRDRDAVAFYEKSLDIYPDEPDALNNLAYLYAEGGMKLEKAERMVKKSIFLYEEKDKKQNAMDTLGWVYYKLGRYGDALDQFEKAERQLSGSPVYHYHLGMTLYMLGDTGRAEKELRAALAAAEGDLKDKLLQALANIGERTEKDKGI